MDYSAMSTAILRKMAVLIRSHPQRQMGKYFGGEKFTLNFLMHINRAALPGELSIAMEASSARVAAILNSLERKGLVLRKMDGSDRRKILVTITDGGKLVVMQNREHIHNAVERVLRELGEEDSKECLRLIGRVIEITGRGGGGAPK